MCIGGLDGCVVLDIKSSEKLVNWPLVMSQSKFSGSEQIAHCACAQSAPAGHFLVQQWSPRAPPRARHMTHRVPRTEFCTFLACEAQRQDHEARSTSVVLALALPRRVCPCAPCLGVVLASRPEASGPLSQPLMYPSPQLEPDERPGCAFPFLSFLFS